jgi:hypothetical protein
MTPGRNNCGCPNTSAGLCALITVALMLEADIPVAA